MKKLPHFRKDGRASSRNFCILSFVAILLIFATKTSFAASTTLNSSGDNKTYGELNLKLTTWERDDTEFFSGVGTLGDMNNSDISGVSGVQERWDVTHRVKVPGSTNHTEIYVFTYDFSDYGSPIGPAGSASNYVLMRRAHGTTGNWTNAGGSVSISGDKVIFTNVTTSCGVDNDFAIATKDKTNSPLPVTWINFGATVEGFTNVVNWSTATELNNDRFEIERTIDGMFFTTIGTVKGAGNSNQILMYQFIDNAPITGCAYRIKQVDFDGKFDYSKIIIPKKENTISSTKPEVTICPNPANTGSNITIDLKNLGLYDNKLSIIDAYGKLIFEETIDIRQAFLNLENLNQGLYIISIYNRNNIISKKLIVK